MIIIKKKKEIFYVLKYGRIKDGLNVSYIFDTSVAKICIIKYIIYEYIIIHNNITTKSGTCGAVSGDRGTLRFPYGSYNENLRQWY